MRTILGFGIFQHCFKSLPTLCHLLLNNTLGLYDRVFEVAEFLNVNKKTCKVLLQKYTLIKILGISYIYQNKVCEILLHIPFLNKVKLLKQRGVIYGKKQRKELNKERFS